LRSEKPLNLLKPGALYPERDEKIRRLRLKKTGLVTAVAWIRPGTRFGCSRSASVGRSSLSPGGFSDPAHEGYAAGKEAGRGRLVWEAYRNSIRQ